MVEKITNLMILFQIYRAGENSLKMKTKKGLTVVTDEGFSFIKGRWASDLYAKHYTKFFKKSKLIERLR